MKILVLATDYPRPDGYVAQYFIHTRNIEYVKKGLEVTVMSFSTPIAYCIDGIQVITKNNVDVSNYDIVVSHAPNLRNHYLFLKRNMGKIKNLIFFFHGHEVLKSNEIYPEAFHYVTKSSKLKKVTQNIYDEIKLSILRNFIEKHIYKIEMVFVSEWMQDMFDKYIKLKLPKEIVNKKSHVIYNSIGSIFEKQRYDTVIEKKYDYITIRNMLDKSKYGIDIVVSLAEKNKQSKFCIVGKGEFFNHYKLPQNIVLIEKHLTHEEVIEFLNQSKVALMPTRADAQGVMACEMATFGIPLITSDIDVCRQIFSGFDNVKLISNNSFSKMDVDKFMVELNINSKDIPKKFLVESTINKEYELFNKVI
ncbi:glycosyltransferase [Exiguobacterium sp. CH10]|uniref:glycosyltransferase n=1 Tax=Exiguobacterium sp. CH10 TaxID=2751261 RepID=UPI001BE5C178|nr:glycosyltransferase [Exiguobacterium sp. CH10]